MKVVALAGGIGAGKFLRGLDRASPARPHRGRERGDDIEIHGLHVSPDLDSVTYWLGDLIDRERGWGRRGETFRATEELRASGAVDAWFNLGDLDLATHLLRTQLLARGPHAVGGHRARSPTRFGVTADARPVTRRPASTTRIDVVDAGRASRSTCTSRSTG